jgi:hypothetical protein
MLVTGIIHVTGEPDVGKTTFALESGASPERTWFVDDDVKGQSTVGELLAAGYQFGRSANCWQLATNSVVTTI